MDLFKYGKFVTADAYKAITSLHLKIVLWKVVCFANCIPRHSFKFYPMACN